MTTAEELRARVAGKPGVSGATIITTTGLTFDFIDPKPEMIDPVDIGWGLARTCRFGGQMKRGIPHYSVAQHSLLVAHLVALDGFGGWVLQQALLHDAAEAYLGDMVGPLKQLLPEFKEIERRVEKVIFERFDVPYPMHACIKVADLQALRLEQHAFTLSDDSSWDGTGVALRRDATIQPAWDITKAVNQWMPAAYAVGIR